MTETEDQTMSVPSNLQQHQPATLETTNNSNMINVKVSFLNFKNTLQMMIP